MNMGDIIKMKMLMSFGGDKDNENQGIFTMIIIFLISILEQHFNVIWKTIQKQINDRWNSTVSNLAKSTNLSKQTHDKYNIFLEKDLSKESKNQQDDKYLESILYNISEKHNLESVMYFKSLYVVNIFTQFQIENDIYGKIHALEYDSDFNISHIKLQISSDTSTVVDLKKYIEECYDIYKRKIQNNLGSNLYFFDQKKAIVHHKMDGAKEYPPFLLFEYNKFVTNRRFNNVFGENMNILKKRVNFFKNNKEWYDEKGIPYTFGALLHGPAGTGKTSVIKSIANECNRHIININLKEIKTNTQLKNLFYKRDLICQDNINQVTFELDIEEKIFVIEDIDCMSEIVLDRKMSSNLEDLEELEEELAEESEEEQQQDEYDIFGLLIKKECQECQECKLGHHEEHCYTVIKKFCPHCKSTNKQIANCKKCKNVLEHCDKPGHCENYLGLGKDNPTRRCIFCLNKFEKTDFDLRQIEKNKLLQCGGRESGLTNGYSSFTGNGGSNEEKTENNDLITLSSLLNILDGTLELPGRMMIITSNFPEKLDSALIRPGRIDLILELGRASANTIKEMYESFYTTKMEIDTLDTLPNDKWTPAEINCILFNNFDNPEAAINDIINTEPNSISKFT